MFSNFYNEIKKKCFNNQKQIQPLSEKLMESVKEPEYKSVQVPVQVPVQKKGGLISCYEEDYTRNSAEIMKLWQRN